MSDLVERLRLRAKVASRTGGLQTHIDLLNEAADLIERLPVTKDGKHRIPCSTSDDEFSSAYMVIEEAVRWGRVSGREGKEEDVEFWIPEYHRPGKWDKQYRYFNVSDCFSTKEAAEQAAKENP